MTEETTPCAEVRIPVPWGHLAGRWYGDQMQRPILALHGWLDNCGTFIKLVPLLLPHCSLLCIDLPGNGFSSHLPAGIMYNRLHYVITILRIMEAYKWEKVSLLGHSMGGGIAFEFATYYPKRVDLFITLDMLSLSDVPEIDMHVQYLQYVVERALIQNNRLVRQSPMSEPPSYTMDDCESLLFDAAGEFVNLDKCKYILERNISPSSKYPAKYYFSHDGRLKTIYNFHMNNDFVHEMTARICREKIPYLMIRAGETADFYRMANVQELLHKHHTNFEYHNIPGELHHLHLNNPEPVAKLIIAFLQKYRHMQTEAQVVRTSKL